MDWKTHEGGGRGFGAQSFKSMLGFVELAIVQHICFVPAVRDLKTALKANFS